MPTYFGDGGALTDAPALARSVLGTADPGEVARELDAFCAARLGSGIGGVFLCEVSVGAVFGARVERGPVGMRGYAYEAPPGARRPRWRRPRTRRRGTEGSRPQDGGSGPLVRTHDRWEAAP